MKLLDLSENRSTDHSHPSLILATDSAIQRDSRPVFLPDISDRWECRISVAYRISRLGKTIGKRFAGRYYDAFTLAARLIPLDLWETLDRQGDRLSPLATAFDGAVALGQWFPLPTSGTVALTSPTEASASLPTDTEAIDSAIELLSRSFIFKTGDVVIPSTPVISFPAQIDTRVKADIGESSILTFKIK